MLRIMPSAPQLVTLSGRISQLEIDHGDDFLNAVRFVLDAQAVGFWASAADTVEFAEGLPVTVVANLS